MATKAPLWEKGCVLTIRCLVLHFHNGPPFFSSLFYFFEITLSIEICDEQLVEGVPTACTTIEEVSSVSLFELPLVCFFLAASSWDSVASDQGCGILLLVSSGQCGAATALRDGVEQLRDLVPEHMFQLFCDPDKSSLPLGTATPCMRIFSRSYTGFSFLKGFW
jgi:hypothetical protein